MGTYNVTELDAHSLYGTMEAQATHNWFKSQGKRTMIIERRAMMAGDRDKGVPESSSQFL